MHISVCIKRPAEMRQFNTTISRTLDPTDVIKGHFYNVQLR